MNLGSVINVAKLLRGRIIETNCVLENTPPPFFGLDVVYKIGGRINGTLQYWYPRHMHRINRVVLRSSVVWPPAFPHTLVRMIGYNRSSWGGQDLAQPLSTMGTSPAVSTDRSKTLGMSTDTVPTAV